MLTLAHLGLALAPILQVIESVDHSQDLHSTDGIEHVWVMTGCSTKAAVIVLTRKNEVYGLIPREGVWMAKQVQGDEAPINAVEAEVFGEPIVVLILAGVQALDILDMVGGGELQLIGKLIQLGWHREVSTVLLILFHSFFLFNMVCGRIDVG